MAEAFAHLEQFDSVMECPICLEVINKPKQLICSHYFCEECFLDWMNNSNDKSMPIHCPSCWQAVPKAINEGVSTKNMAGLPSDVTEGQQCKTTGVMNKPDCNEDSVKSGDQTNKLYNNKKNNVNEGTTNSKQSVDKSPACSQNSAAEISGKVSSGEFKGEVQTTRTKTSTTTTTEHFCHTHNKEINFFCETCKESICRQCVVAKHLFPDLHAVFDINIVAEKADRMFTTSIQKQIINSDKIDKEINKLVSSTDQIEREYRRTMADIDEVFTELENNLHRKIQELKDEASAIRLERNKRVETQLKHMTEMKASELHVKEVCENALKSGKAFDKVELASSIGSHCRSVRCNDIKAFTIDTTVMRFADNPTVLRNIKEGLQNIGKIHYNKSGVPHHRIHEVETDMPTEMQRFAIELVRGVCKKHQRNPFINRADSITNQMNAKYGCTWCCFIGHHHESCNVPLNFKLTMKVDSTCKVVLFKIPSVTNEGLKLAEYTIQKVSSNNMSPNMILDAIDLIYTACRSGSETRNDLSYFISSRFSHLHGGRWSCLIVGGAYFWHPGPVTYVTFIMGQEYFIIWRI